MLMISSRDKFWDSNRLSNSDEIRDVVLDDNSLGVPVDINDFLNMVRNNNTFAI